MSRWGRMLLAALKELASTRGRPVTVSECAEILSSALSDHRTRMNVSGVQVYPPAPVQRSYVQ